MAAQRPRAERPLKGPKSSRGGGCGFDLLQGAALLLAVGVAVVLLAPDRHAPAARAGGVITIARGPQAAVGRLVLQPGTRAQVRVTVHALGGDAAADAGAGATGTVALDADTFVIRGRVRCLRTTRTSAVIGVSARTISLTTGRQETRSGVVVLERRPDSGVATYQLEPGARRPTAAPRPGLTGCPSPGGPSSPGASGRPPAAPAGAASRRYSRTSSKARRRYHGTARSTGRARPVASMSARVLAVPKL